MNTAYVFTRTHMLFTHIQTNPFAVADPGWATGLQAPQKLSEASTFTKLFFSL